MEPDVSTPDTVVNAYYFLLQITAVDQNGVQYTLFSPLELVIMLQIVCQDDYNATLFGYRGFGVGNTFPISMTEEPQPVTIYETEPVIYSTLTESSYFPDDIVCGARTTHFFDPYAMDGMTPLGGPISNYIDIT